jgi:hypothetical protein
MLLLHLGMTGYLQVCPGGVGLTVGTKLNQKKTQVKGIEPFKYVQKTKVTDGWPPRFVKVYHLCVNWVF